MRKLLIICLVLACIFAFVVCFGGSIIISIRYDGTIELPAEEEFYQDDNNVYYFPAVRSSRTIVTYLNGDSEDIVTALEAGRATIADLDRFGIKYFAKPKR